MTKIQFEPWSLRMDVKKNQKQTEEKELFFPFLSLFNCR